MPDLTDREERLCKSAGAEGARESLRSLGLDVDNPREVQQDLAMLRRMRMLRDKGSVAFTLVVISVVVTGIAGLIWDAIRK